MPNPLSSTFITAGTPLSWTFTTEARPNLIWTFTTTGKALSWTFTTESRDLVWSFTTGNPLSWTFTTEDRPNLIWTFTTQGEGLVWTFTTIEEGYTQIGNFLSWRKVNEGDCDKIFIGIRANAQVDKPTMIITNIRTGAQKQVVLTGNQFNFGTELTKDKDGVHEVYLVKGSAINGFGRILVNCKNCFYDLAIAEQAKGGLCTKCNDLAELRAINNVIQIAFKENDYELVHKMMDVLDDICTDCNNC
jgi:hypothetical protein